MNRTSPLQGITVVELTQAMAGPFCAMTLGDLGADVIKVERPGMGDQSRTWGPPFEGGESSYFMSVNRNKRSVILNLKAEGGRVAMQGLLQQADVFMTNLPRGSQRVSNGVDGEALRAVSPRLVYCWKSGRVSSGPRGVRRGSA
jgi:formyl-CoA transferase